MMWENVPTSMDGSMHLVLLAESLDHGVQLVDRTVNKLPSPDIYSGPREKSGNTLLSGVLSQRVFLREFLTAVALLVIG